MPAGRPLLAGPKDICRTKPPSLAPSLPPSLGEVRQPDVDWPGGKEGGREGGIEGEREGWRKKRHEGKWERTMKEGYKWGGGLGHVQ